jgi:hypothetical protein
MKHSTKTITLLLLLILSLVCNISLCFGEEKVHSNLTGVIYISIKGEQGSYGYYLDLRTNNFEATCDVLKSTSEKYPGMHSEHGGVPKNKDQSIPLKMATEFFTPQEMLSISHIFLQSKTEKDQLNSIRIIAPLDEMKGLDLASRALAYEAITLNEQRTYAVLKSTGYNKGNGSIIDIKRKHIVIPFGGDEVKDFEWSPDGKFIAYAIGSIKELFGNTLVIYDVANHKAVLEKNGEELIDSLAWSPSSDNVAVLTRTSRFFSLNPWNLFLLIGGHPKEESSFTLRIFDFEKEVKTTKGFLKGVNNARGVMLWKNIW